MEGITYEPIKENEGIGFSYTVTEEQVRRHQSLSPEEIFDWIQQTATFIYELQTPEEREHKYIFKPNKRIPLEFLRKDI
ncbi:MAG: hypothetical protein JWO03_301 [Bacteroidetes bacterium]|nr:hypothetical protein [Bacteroidota bacterium]